MVSHSGGWKSKIRVLLGWFPPRLLGLQVAYGIIDLMQESEQTPVDSGGQGSVAVLQSIGSQRVGPSRATEQQQQPFLLGLPRW